MGHTSGNGSLTSRNGTLTPVNELRAACADIANAGQACILMQFDLPTTGPVSRYGLVRRPDCRRFARAERQGGRGRRSQALGSPNVEPGSRESVTVTPRSVMLDLRYRS